MLKRVRRILQMPPHVITHKVLAISLRRILKPLHYLRDHLHSTYTKEPPQGNLNLFFPGLKMNAFWSSRHNCIGAVCRHYLDHRFDLPGTGWVQVKHGMHCQGLEGFRYEMGTRLQIDGDGKWLKGRINRANLLDSQQIWRMVDRDYVPIDWHLDFKSGYRWSETTWHRDIVYGPKPGVDVKVPWELSRMQHLAQLVWAYALDKDGYKGVKTAQVFGREFRNQVLDFISTNPPRFGVNWISSMDVAIRVVNWLVVYDLFRAYGLDFDDEFDREFSHSVRDHGLHIVNNLEWSPELRGNHYFANIVGLLFVAAYLPRTAETDVWMAFAVQELVKEVEHQFTCDGANFEASTSYHCLSAEMVVYGTALVLGLPKAKLDALKDYDFHRYTAEPALKPAPTPLYPIPGTEQLAPFPAWYYERLEKMAEFTLHITKPNVHIPQIGDNDSGRFLKLQAVYHRMTVAQAKARYANLEGYDGLPDDDIYWDEDNLDPRHLVAAINGLFDRNDFTDFTGDGWLEAELIRSLSRGVRLASYREPGDLTAAEKVEIGSSKSWKRLLAELNSSPEYSRQTVKFQVPYGNIREQAKTFAYPYFGLYIYRSRHLYMAVRCGPIGQDGNGGHAHNDQLSLELSVDGEDWIRDPGTYLYTPLPARRNEYRSVKAHFAPWVEGREPGCLDLGTFRLGNEAKAECLYFGVEGFGGRHWGYGKPVYRIVTLRDDLIRIEDFAEGQTRISPAYGYSRVENEVNFAGFGVALAKVLPISDKYGSLMK